MDEAENRVYFYKWGGGGWSKYGDSLDNNKLGEYNWCAAFVSWCARKAGVPTSKLPTNANASMNCNSSYWRDNDGSFIPSEGDIIFYGSSKTSINHVGIVYDITPATANKPTRVHTIEGNTNMGCVATQDYEITKSNILGFCDIY
ncbi:MAG: DUF2272 domain-containing protein [Oscillospiraceae bacterium]|nr:DUF2272 domain-containing protein [Oscillospiraceae bacterium]